MMAHFTQASNLPGHTVVTGLLQLACRPPCRVLVNSVEVAWSCDMAGLTWWQDEVGQVVQPGVLCAPLHHQLGWSRSPLVVAQGNEVTSFFIQLLCQYDTGCV